MVKTAMMLLLLSLVASTAGEAAAREEYRVARAQHEFAPALLAPVPRAHHEDQASSRRLHVPAAVVAACVVASPEGPPCESYQPPSLAPLTPSATPSSQRDPPSSPS
jgi:hypothetical protein